MGKYKLGIMGTGAIAKVMVDTVKRMKDVECYAVGSKSMERAMRFSRDNCVKNAYGSYEELAQDDNIDLVYIASLNIEHYFCMKVCIDNKKPMLVEKPFSLNSRLAAEVIGLVREKNIFLAEAMTIRYLPFVDTIKHVLEENIIGETQLMTLNFSCSMMQKKRLLDPQLGGGVLYDLGVYPLNVVFMLWGYNYQQIESTCVYTETGVDKHISITISYPDGKMACINCSMSCVGDRNIIIQGEKGYIQIGNINNFSALQVYNNSRKIIKKYNLSRQKLGYELELSECLKAISKGKIECDKMKHSDTICVMNAMDQIREQWK